MVGRVGGWAVPLCYTEIMTAIKQLQLGYNPEEDRILFRINTTGADEFRFWLTRRYSMLLAKALNDHRAVDPDVSAQTDGVAKQAIQEFKRDEAISKGNFEEKFTPSTNFPLGEEPVLAFKLSYRIENEKLHLSINPKEGSGINLVVDQQLNFSITKLLETAIKSGDWGIRMAASEDAVPVDRVIN